MTDLHKSERTGHGDETMKANSTDAIWEDRRGRELTAELFSNVRSKRSY